MSLFNIPLPEPTWLERKQRIYSPDDEDVLGCNVTPLYTAEQMDKYVRQILDELHGFYARDENEQS